MWAPTACTSFIITAARSAAGVSRQVWKARYDERTAASMSSGPATGARPISSSVEGLYTAKVSPEVPDVSLPSITICDVSTWVESTMLLPRVIEMIPLGPQSRFRGLAGLPQPWPGDAARVGRLRAPARRAPPAADHRRTCHDFSGQPSE